MPKYWGNKFSHTGVSPKRVKRNRRREKEKRERAKVSNYDGQYLTPEPK